MLIIIIKVHLHGASFAILAMQKLNRSIKIDEVIKMDEMGKITRNFDRPPIKDTVTVPVGGNLKKNLFLILTKVK